LKQFGPEGELVAEDAAGEADGDRPEVLPVGGAGFVAEAVGGAGFGTGAVAEAVGGAWPEAAAGSGPAAAAGDEGGAVGKLLRSY